MDWFGESFFGPLLLTSSRLLSFLLSVILELVSALYWETVRMIQRCGRLERHSSPSKCTIRADEVGESLLAGIGAPPNYQKKCGAKIFTASEIPAQTLAIISQVPEVTRVECFIRSIPFEVKESVA